MQQHKKCISQKATLLCFNTASSRHIHSILFVFPSPRSGTRNVRTSSSLRSSAGTLHRIPQAISTVATHVHSKRSIRICSSVSIPQAVGTFTLSFSFSPPFGQGLEMCGPHRRFAPLLSRPLYRIHKW